MSRKSSPPRLERRGLRVLKEIDELNEPLIVNLGTGQGYSVLEMIKAFEEASGTKIPYEIVERRPGDIAEIYANPNKAKKLLGWVAKRGIKEMCESTWNYINKNS